MYQGHRIGALILMGGDGCRFGGDVPKQFLMLGEKRIYLHTLDVFARSAIFDEILLVCHRDWISAVEDEAPGVRIIPGGATRQESSYLGLQGFSENPDIVAIHDAVRPFVSEDLLKENVARAILHGAADTCIPSADTLVFAPGGERIEAIPKREEYLRGQTPQTFRFDWICEAHKEAIREGISNASDDCRLVLRRGLPIYVVRGSEGNIKITTEFDLMLAEILVQRAALQKPSIF